MTQCCLGDNLRPSGCSGKNAAHENSPSKWFSGMIQHCLDYAVDANQNGVPIVGIMCEYTPRELIIAAGAIPVCLCGGSLATIGTAEKDLPTNLCPLIKSTYGYHAQKNNPFLEMASLIVAETTCDGKKKMYELMAQNRPVYILELPQKPDDADAMKHWVAELKKFKVFLEKRFSVKITGQKIREAIELMNNERRLRRRLAESMKSNCPPYTGRMLLDFKSVISGIDADLRKYEEQLELNRKSEPVCESGKKVRVLLTGVPMVHGAEKVMDIIEEHGGIVVCMDNCTGIKPIMDDVDISDSDPIAALAKKYFSLPCSVMTKNNRRIELLKTLISQYQPECIIDVVWQACLTYDVESYFIKKLCEDEFSMPYLKIGTDYSPSDSERIAVRVEALFETVKTWRQK